MNRFVQGLKGRGLTIFFGLLISFSTSAQSCPTVKRNNGNNAAHTEYATSVINTSYTTVPSSSKEGTITVILDQHFHLLLYLLSKGYMLAARD